MKPMLATAVELNKITYPLFASVKLDGIRAIVKDQTVLTRSLKPVRNQHVQEMLGMRHYEGLDGELIVGEPNAEDVFNKTTSGVMKATGRPQFTFQAFDIFDSQDDYIDRKRHLEEYEDTHILRVLPQKFIACEEDLLEFEQRTLSNGYEGIMLRALMGKYKYGRSTVREGYLLKRKPLADAEAVVIGYNYLMRNLNEATVDELGHTKRSSSLEGKVEDTTQIGTLEVRVMNGPFEGVHVSIGTGFTQNMRESMAQQGLNLLGEVLTFSYQLEGSKDKPRFPSFKGFRHQTDIS